MSYVENSRSGCILRPLFGRKRWLQTHTSLHTVRKHIALVVSMHARLMLKWLEMVHRLTSSVSHERLCSNKPIRHVVCAGALGQVKTDTLSHATKTS